jgi:LytS/YehU family sensor histidine kinase
VLRAARRDSQLVLEVEDNGMGLKSGQPKRLGVGLSNTRDRLEHLYGSRQSFEFLPAKSGGLTVQVVMPFRLASSSGPTNNNQRSSN